MGTKDLKILAVIPARLASKRFPNKPFADIFGMPMIGHVFHRTRQCKHLTDVIVATPDNEIMQYIEKEKGIAIKTSHEHLRSVDRVVEAVKILEQETKLYYDIVVMVQGDEPMVTEFMISNVVSALVSNPKNQITHLMTEITNEEEVDDPNAIKVVVDIYNNALYMSRSPIPFYKWQARGLPILKKVNVVAFTHDFLFKFAEMQPTPLEIMESIGMLRLIENGIKIKMVLSDYYTVSVDTPKDLELVKELMRDDYYLKKYLSDMN